MFRARRIELHGTQWEAKRFRFVLIDCEIFANRCVGYRPAVPELEWSAAVDARGGARKTAWVLDLEAVIETPCDLSYGGDAKNYSADSPPAYASRRSAAPA
jgi:hypothetical protein